MNKTLKAVLLIVILIMPALIFVFLKIFGANQYELPVYYQDGVDTTFTDCEFQKGLHLIPDFSFPDYSGKEITGNSLNGVSLVVYFTQDLNHLISDRVNMAMARVQGSLTDEHWISFLTILSNNASSQVSQLENIAKKYDALESNWIFGYANPVYTNQLARCGFVLDFDAKGDNINDVIVLSDNEGKIRGYFKATDDAEIERLIVELKILNRNRK